MLDIRCGENKATRQLIITAAIMVARRSVMPFARQFVDTDNIPSLYDAMYVQPQFKSCLDDSASLVHLLCLLRSNSLQQTLLRNYFMRGPPSHLKNPDANARWVTRAIRDVWTWWWTWSECEAFKRTINILLKQQALK